MSDAQLRVALVQLEIAWEDPAKTFLRARPWLEHAKSAGARLAILPEMFATGFSMAAERIAEPEGGPIERWLGETARALDLWLVAGVAQRPSGDATGSLPVNAALVVSPSGAIAARYHKVHPFSFAREHEHYRGGDGVATAAIGGARVTPIVCYDLRFPELFRVAADSTDVFVVIANWPAARRAHWQTLLRARAIENQAWVLGVNRVGEGGGLAYAGDSMVVAPDGEVIASAAMTETALVVDCDCARVDSARASFPVLRDRRPDAYRTIR